MVINKFILGTRILRLNWNITAAAHKMAAETNKTLVLTGTGGYDKLQIEQRAYPEPEKGQVVIKVHASGINFAELMARQGMYGRSTTYPCVLGSEGAGEVVKVGPEVTKVKEGQRVICLTTRGVWCEYVAVSEDRCFVMPTNMTYEEGAAIPINYVTAYHMLFDLGHLRKGKSVLIHMVAGGVGNAAVQLCRTVEDVTIFGTCSALKHDVMRKAGVTHPIDYRNQDYVTEVRKIQPKGVDIVLDPLSGADSLKGYKLLKPLGSIIHFGAANMVTGEQRSLWTAFSTWWSTSNYNPLSMMSQNRSAAGYHLGYLLDSPETITDAVEELLRMHREGKIHPVIDSTWPLEDVDKAMERMHERKNVGKVVLCPQKKAGEGEIRSAIK